MPPTRNERVKGENSGLGGGEATHFAQGLTHERHEGRRGHRVPRVRTPRGFASLEAGATRREQEGVGARVPLAPTDMLNEKACR